MSDWRFRLDNKGEGWTLVNKETSVFYRAREWDISVPCSTKNTSRPSKHSISGHLIPEEPFVVCIPARAERAEPSTLYPKLEIRYGERPPRREMAPGESE